MHLNVSLPLMKQWKQCLTIYSDRVLNSTLDLTSHPAFIKCTFPVILITSQNQSISSLCGQRHR